MSKLLSLDASSSIIGITIFDIDTKSFVAVDYLVHDKTKSLIERVMDFRDKLRELRKIYNDLDTLVIESSFQGFFGGGSSAQTIEVLTSVNFGYRLIAHMEGMQVNEISVHEARKNCFPGVKIKTLAKLRGQKEKETCFDLALPMLGEEYLTKKTITKGKNKGKEVFEDYCYDIVDSYITGRGFLNTL